MPLTTTMSPAAKAPEPPVQFAMSLKSCRLVGELIGSPPTQFHVAAFNGVAKTATNRSNREIFRSRFIDSSSYKMGKKVHKHYGFTLSPRNSSAMQLGK